MSEPSFCTKADVTVFLPSVNGYVKSDPEIEALIPEATADIQRYTRRKWIKASYTQYSSTTIGVGQRIYLIEKPLDQSVAVSVRFDASGLFTTYQQLVLNTDYFVEETQQGTPYVRLRNSLGSWSRAIMLTYTAGYTMDSSGLVQVNSILKNACAKQVAYKITKRLNLGNYGITSRMDDAKNLVRYGPEIDGLAPEIAASLNTSRRQLVGV